MMLAPQFTLRRLLAAVTISGFVCLIVAAALRGHIWAAAVVIALAGMVITLVVYGFLFVFVRGIGGAFRRRKPAAGIETKPAPVI